MDTNKKSGKTFRYFDKGKKNNASIIINTRDRSEYKTEIFGFEFEPGVQYALQKKQRWRLQQRTLEDHADVERPFVYTQQQCIVGDWPKLDLYVYDSSTNTTMGSYTTKNTELGKCGVNLDSVMNQIENRDDYTEREKKSLLKLRNKNSKNKRVSKCTTSEMDEGLPPKTEHASYQEQRQNCVYISEFIPMNDISKVNMIKPNNYKFRYNRKVEKKKFNYDLSDSDYEYSDEEFEKNVYNVEVEEYSIKPFIIEGSDLICRNREVTCKRKKQKKKTSFFPSEYCLNAINLLNDADNIEHNDAIQVYDDVLPSVVFDVSRDKFISDLELILSFCKCWKCCVSPLTILVDLDAYEETREKSFVLLKPNVQKSENVISVNVLFNVSNCGLETSIILDFKFESLVELVTLLQSQLRSGVGKKLVTLEKVVMCDRSIDELSNLPKVLNIEGTQYLYLFDDEWKNCELNINNLNTILNLNDKLDYSMEDCSVCQSSIPDDEIIIMGKCEHRVCEKCLSGHIIQGLDAHNYTLSCPCDNCQVLLDAPTLLSLVSWKHYQLRLDILETNVLERCGKPCIECDSVLIMNNTDVSKQRNKAMEYVCVCGRYICSMCGQIQHWASSCEEMKEHNVKMEELQDSEHQLLKQKQVISTNTLNCSSCKATMTGRGLKPNLRCPCNRMFCQKCRVSYKKHVDKCQVYIDDKCLFPDSTTVIPFQEAKSHGLKFYNQSVYLRLLLRKDNLDKFKHDIHGIMTSALVSGPLLYSVDELTCFYSQVLRILESMYVSAYNAYKKYNPYKLRKLQLATNQLLFYVGRIQSLTEEIRDFIKHGNQGHNKDTIKSKYNKLEGHINNARLYTKKTMLLLKY